MKKVKNLLIALIIGVFGVAAPVFAQEDTPTKPTDTQSSEDKATAQAIRLQALKEQKNEKLDEATSARVKSRCKAAQIKVLTLQEKVMLAASNREKVYSEIGAKLDTLIVRLQTAGIDTTNLEQIKDDVQADLIVLVQTLDDYDVLLKDLFAMNCETNPDAFQAVLLSAREQQSKVRTLATDFKIFATTQLRTELQNIRSQFADNANLENNSTEAGGNQ